MKRIQQESEKLTTLDLIIKDFERQGGENPKNNAITIEGILYILKTYSSLELEQMKDAFNAGALQSNKYKFWHNYHKETYKN